MSAEVKSFRDLIAWQRSFRFGVDVYRATKGFPTSEQYGLVSQLRRSAVSVASNIAEGFGRQSRLEYVRFLRIARGSLFEVETQLLFAFELGYLPDSDRARLVQCSSECGRILAGLIRSLEMK